MLNQNDDNNEIKKMVMLCIAAASCVLLVFLAFLYSNEKSNSIKKQKALKEEKALKEAMAQEDAELEIGKNNLVSEDLDFWDMYNEKYSAAEVEDDEEEEDDKISLKEIADRLKDSSSVKSEDTSEDAFDDASNEDSMNDDELSDDDKKMDDGKHIKVETETGSFSWYEIDDSLQKNSHDFNKYLSYQDGEIKYIENDEEALIGVDISRKSGTIDFSKVKNAGIDYVMLKVGSRGYSMGEITLDDKFVEYASACKEVGIPLGAYFESMAITDVEAVEEANYSVAACVNYGITFPIAIDLNVVKNDSYRSSKLTNKERTLIVKTFCDTVKNYGYKPIICADKSYLIAKLNLSDLMEYDFWVKDSVNMDDIRMLDDEVSSSSTSTSSSSSSSRDSSKTNSKQSIVPNSSSKNTIVGTDYPYKFNMWQYSTKGSINGIDGAVDLNMSFVDYDKR